MGQGLARPRNPAKAIAALAVVGGLLALILTSCPANRDGMPGQLATATEQTQSAARSAALALQLWSDHRSPGSLAAVQITDARDEIVQAYKDIAELQADSRVDLAHQRVLADKMAALIADLNVAAAVVRGEPVTTPDPRPLRQHLLAVADVLEQIDRR